MRLSPGSEKSTSLSEVGKEKVEKRKPYRGFTRKNADKEKQLAMSKWW